MFEFFSFIKKNRPEVQNKSVLDIAESELDKNRGVFESLKDYDEGRKNISITVVKKHLRNI